MRTLKLPIRRLDALAFSPDGAELAAGGTSPGAGPAGLLVGPPDGSAAPRHLLAGSDIRSLTYTPGGRLLAAVFGADAGVYALDTRTPAAPPDRLPLVGPVAVAAGRLLATVAARPGWHFYGWAKQFACRRLAADGTVAPLWDVACGAGEYAAGVALLADGRAVTLTHAGAGSGASVLTLALRAADTGRELATTRPPGQTPGPLTVSPGGEHLVLNAGGSLFIWRIDDGFAPPRKLTFGRKHCTGVGFLPDGRLLAAGNDGTVRILDPDTGATAATYTFAAGKVRSLAVAPDGLTAAVGTDRGTVILFDLD